MLAELLKEGYSVESVFPAPPEVVLPHGNANGTPWSVTNFEHETTAPQLSLIDATALSINTVYAQVVARIGAANLDAMAEALGISPSELPGAYPSQVLGTADVSPLEMAAAYATFADGGVYHAPLLITKVTTATGSPCPCRSRRSSRVVLTPAEAAMETYVLQQVVLWGTGTAAGDVGSPVAGKTGTTEHSSDAWFIGYTPHLTTAVWMGYASEQPAHGQLPRAHQRAGRHHPGPAVAQLHGGRPGVRTALDRDTSRWCTPFGGQTLTPPEVGSTVLFPEGLGHDHHRPPTTTIDATTSAPTTAPPRAAPCPRPDRLPTSTVPPDHRAGDHSHRHHPGASSPPPRPRHRPGGPGAAVPTGRPDRHVGAGTGSDRDAPRPAPPRPGGRRGTPPAADPRPRRRASGAIRRIIGPPAAATCGHA